jgi:tetratricopeptide (TPR) repeat protein
VRAEEEARDTNLRRGTVAYLKGDLEEAETLFRACVKADPLDVEALFRLGVVCARSGDVLHARTCLRRTLKHDAEAKWRWEAGRELEALKKATTSLPTPPEQETHKETEPNSV